MLISDARKLKRGDTVSFEGKLYEIVSKGKFHNPSTNRPTLGFKLKGLNKDVVFFRELDSNLKRITLIPVYPTLVNGEIKMVPLGPNGPKIF